jgi:hypothetical protein
VTRNAEIEDIRLHEQMKKHADAPGKAASRKIKGNIEMFLLARHPRRNLFICGLKMTVKEISFHILCKTLSCEPLTTETENARVCYW